LVFHVFAALAEFERDLVRERTSAGLAAARARGRHGGRPSVMTAHKLRVAQEMYRSGQYTVTTIATTLGVSRASIYRHLGGSSRQGKLEPLLGRAMAGLTAKARHSAGRRFEGLGLSSPGARVAMSDAFLVTDASREAPNSSAPFGNDW
jgi:hypothetical protein